MTEYPPAVAAHLARLEALAARLDRLGLAGLARKIRGLGAELAAGVAGDTDEEGTT